jgi:hypothetical protein
MRQNPQFWCYVDPKAHDIACFYLVNLSIWLNHAVITQSTLHLVIGFMWCTYSRPLGFKSHVVKLGPKIWTQDFLIPIFSCMTLLMAAKLI